MGLDMTMCTLWLMVHLGLAFLFIHPVGRLSEEATAAVVIWLLVWGVLRGVLHFGVFR
jgi:hypothetical protein